MSDGDVSVLDSCIALLMFRGEVSAAGEVAAAGYRLLRADRLARNDVVVDCGDCVFVKPCLNECGSPYTDKETP